MISMKTKIFLIAVIAASFLGVQAIASVFATKVAQAQISFGGRTLPIAPCNDGFLSLVVGTVPTFIKTLTPVPAGFQVLGVAPAIPVPCIFIIVPVGSGLQAGPVGPTFGISP